MAFELPEDPNQRYVRITGTLPFEDVTDILPAKRRQAEASRRSAAQDFLKTKKAFDDAGQPFTGTELLEQRMQMTGGDPLLSKYLPSGSDFSGLTRRSEETLKTKRAELSMKQADFAFREQDFSKKFAMNSPNSSPEEIFENISEVLGEDKALKYKDQIPNWHMEGVMTQVETLSGTALGKSIKTMNDAKIFLGGYSPLVQQKIVERNRELAGKEDRTEINSVVQANAKNIDPTSSAEAIRARLAPLISPDNLDAAVESLTNQKADEVRTIVAALLDKLATDPEESKRLGALKTLYEAGGDEALFGAVQNILGLKGIEITSPEDPLYKEFKDELNIVNFSTKILERKKESSKRLAENLAKQSLLENNNRMSGIGLRAATLAQDGGGNADTLKRSTAIYREAFESMFGQATEAGKHTPGPFAATDANMTALYNHLKGVSIGDVITSTKEWAEAYAGTGRSSEQEAKHRTEIEMEAIYGPAPQRSSQYFGKYADEATKTVSAFKTGADNISIAHKGKSNELKRRLIKHKNEYVAGIESVRDKLKRTAGNPDHVGSLLDYKTEEATLAIDQYNKMIKEIEQTYEAYVPPQEVLDAATAQSLTQEAATYRNLRGHYIDTLNYSQRREYEAHIANRQELMKNLTNEERLEIYSKWNREIEDYFEARRNHPNAKFGW